MILVLREGATAGQIGELSRRFVERGVEIQEVPWQGRTLLVTSSKWKGDLSLFSLDSTVESVERLDTEYQLSSRRFKPKSTVVRISDSIVFGEGDTVMMAGPCAVESRDQVFRTAEFLRTRHDVAVFRAGAFKPRTSPYTFQGMADEGLRLLEQVRETFGMKIITEVKDTTQLTAVAEVADIVQIGAKSMYNFTLLQRCGRLQKPILLKRGFMTTIQEFLQAADFILSNGNEQVILCERGIRTFEPATRFCLDVCGAALIKDLSHLPLVLDPSHAMGYAAQVPAVARAAAAVGVDGLLVEVHPDPARAKSDREQALSFERFTEMSDELRGICKAVGRRYRA